LLVSETTGTPGSIYVYASAPDGGLTRLRDSIDGSLGLSLADMTVSGDGSIAFSAAAEPYGIVEFATSDLSLRRVVPTGAFPNSVEVSSDGRLIAAGSFSCCGPDLFVFRADGTPTGVMELGDDLFARAVAWSPTGRRLYAVTGDAGWGARPAVLHVRNAPQ
jgi:sugar lactone lactonase YvrE